MNRQKQLNGAFTLVELIVVITILAILGTIAFISLQGYSTQSRDSARISDLSTIRTGLELFQLDAGKYPLPTDGEDITYSGGVVWSQGTFGESVFKNIGTLDKIPTDPLTNSLYTYSVTPTRSEYELAGIIETDIAINILDNTYAGEAEATAMVTGTYNGQMTKSLSGTTCNALSIPTIIASDIETSKDLVEITNNKRFVYDGFKNLPHSYRSSKYNADGGFDFGGNGYKLVAYTDTGSCSALTSKSNLVPRIELLKGLQKSYSGTTLKNKGIISRILGLEIDTNNPSIEVQNYAGSFVNNNLGGDVEIIKLDGGSLVIEPFSFPDDLTIMFASNTAWTQNWTVNNCTPSGMTVINIPEDLSSIPGLLLENTIYKLAPGVHQLSPSVEMVNCSAFVGNGDATIRYLNSHTQAIYLNSRTNVIIEGVNVNPVGSTVAPYGITLNNSSNNTLRNIKIFNASFSGLKFTNGDNNTIINLKSYNNDTGVHLTDSDRNIFSNIHIYNNGSYGITFNNNSNYNSFTNINTYSNGNDGFNIYGSTNNIIKNMTSNNNNVGMTINLGGNNYFIDIKNYNNQFYGVKSITSTNYYYEFLNLFQNLSSNINGAGLSAGTGNSIINNLSINTGFYTSIGLYSVSVDTTIPNIVGWDNNLITDQSGLTFDENITYSYGDNIPYQTRPVRWNAGISKFEYYGIDGVDFDMSKHVGEF